MKKIKQIKAREILDSRGNPTVEADLELSDGGFGRASVPSGASTGSHEAVELRDGGERYAGKGVKKAVENINSRLSERIVSKDFDQKSLDAEMISIDGTANKSALGANAVLAVSLAFAKACADSEKIPLWKYFNSLSSAKPSLPQPMMNILNGGKHAEGSVDIQEFMIIPRSDKFAERLRIGTEVFHALKSILSKRKLSTLSGDEGGFAPALSSNEDALSILLEAIRSAGYKEGEDVSLAIDAASESFHSKGIYTFSADKKQFNTEELISLYEDWCVKFPIISIEDGLSEDDWSGWKKLTERIGGKTMIVGDDLFVTNTKRLKKGIEEKAANSILIKLNQIGTVSETIDAIELARESGMQSIVSHRSGETEDSYISHLTVGLGTGWIKTGAPCRGERTAKYNELLRIEEEF